jgi:hypothetical protein
MAHHVDGLDYPVGTNATTTTATAEQTAELFVYYVWKLHRVPNVIISGTEPMLASQFTRALCKFLGTEQALYTT